MSTYLTTIYIAVLQSLANTEYRLALLTLVQIFVITMLAINLSNVFCMSGDAYVAFLAVELL